MPTGIQLSGVLINGFRIQPRPSKSLATRFDRIIGILTPVRLILFYLDEQNARFGFKLSAPVFQQGPLIDIPDNDHNAKTKRNNILGGGRCSITGDCMTTFSTVVRLHDLSVAFADVLGENGLPKIKVLKSRDTFDPDKRDDGAARRFYHATTLSLMTETLNDKVWWYEQVLKVCSF